tara:strand:+ start:7139 stop:8149 length:1011 start_codon:yes stop_codon:yes gene_type:complete
MSNFFNKKTVLITGGTGSFGKAAVRALLKMKNIKKIIVFSRDELKQYEISSQFSKKENKILRFFIGDVRDYKRLEMAARNVDYIIHAAALKQVPTAEYNPFEFIKTNVVGAQNIIEASFKNNVKKVVALSTDKASSPINLYGATKLCSDKLFIAANNMVGDKKISFSVIRYGNVAGSRGSVIPLFLSRREKNEFNVTDPDMTRFNITLEESYKFVFDCLKISTGGEIFIPKIPSYKILDLVKAINENAKINIMGIRPGEKLHEEMISKYESFNTYESKNFYFILPGYNLKKYKNLIKNLKAKKIKSNFTYSSGDNIFMSITQLKQLVRKIKLDNAI